MAADGVVVVVVDEVGREQAGKGKLKVGLAQLGDEWMMMLGSGGTAASGEAEEILPPMHGLAALARALDFLRS